MAAADFAWKLLGAFSTGYPPAAAAAERFPQRALTWKNPADNFAGIE